MDKLKDKAGTPRPDPMSVLVWLILFLVLIGIPWSVGIIKLFTGAKHAIF